MPLGSSTRLLFGASDSDDILGPPPTMSTGWRLQSRRLTSAGVLWVIVADSAVASVADADDFGSSAILTLPNKDLAIVAAKTNLELTKDGTGYVAATDLDVALGTAAASNTTLATTMINIIDKDDLNDADLTPAWAAHTSGNSSAAPLYIAAGASNLIYFNVSGSTESSEDASITLTGTLGLVVQLLDMPTV